MLPLVAIDFACNDPDNGLFAGFVGSASYGDAEIEAPSLRGFRFTEVDGGIRLHGRVFRTEGSVGWLGNWCWNRYWFTRSEAKRLLGTMKVKGWRATCAPHHFYRWMNGDGDD